MVRKYLKFILSIIYFDCMIYLNKISINNINIIIDNKLYSMSASETNFQDSCDYFIVLRLNISNCTYKFNSLF